MAIEVVSTDLGTYTMPWPNTPFMVDFKLQLEAKDVVIVHLQEDVQNFLCETKEKNLVIGSHAFAVDDI
jgi:hypothetical protein